MRLWLLVCIALAVPAGRASSQIVINEVMPAPGTDWTQNGIHSSTEDEWVELFNTGGSTVDVNGWLLGDGAGGSSTPRIGLSGSMLPGEYLYLTGELSVDWEVLNGFPATGLSLNNSGDVLYLFQTAGGTTTLVDSLAWSGSASDVSMGRLPDGTGPVTDFDALTSGGSGPQPTPGGPNGGPATPKILSSSVTPTVPSSVDSITVRAVAGDADGIAECLLLLNVNGGPQQQLAMSLVSGAATFGTWELAIGPYAGGTTLAAAVQVDDGALLEATNPVNLTVIGAGSPVVLNEILADPPTGTAGDANGDGVRDTADDEFVEIVNTSSSSVDLSDWTLHDATSVRHTFPVGTVLQAGEIRVVFGGGTPTGVPGAVEVASTGGLSLNNTGDTVQLTGADGVTRDAHTYGSEANADQSLIRLPDGTGGWTRPGDAGFAWAFSPGATNSVTTALDAVSWAEVKALYR